MHRLQYFADTKVYTVKMFCPFRENMYHNFNFIHSIMYIQMNQEMKKVLSVYNSNKKAICNGDK